MPLIPALRRHRQGIAVSLRPAWSTYRVLDQSGLHSETLSQVQKSNLWKSLQILMKRMKSQRTTLSIKAKIIINYTGHLDSQTCFEKSKTEKAKRGKVLRQKWRAECLSGGFLTQGSDLGRICRHWNFKAALKLTKSLKVLGVWLGHSNLPQCWWLGRCTHQALPCEGRCLKPAPQNSNFCMLAEMQHGVSFHCRGDV